MDLHANSNKTGLPAFLFHKILHFFPNPTHVREAREMAGSTA